MIEHWIRSCGRVAVVELASAASRNALSLPMLISLRSTMEKLSHDDKVHAIVLGHQGPAFSSGHDLRELSKLIQTQDRAGIEEIFRACSAAMASIVESPKPVIAKVDGVATAAGCQLVASCDLAYASKQSSFATPGVSLGLFCSTPAVAIARTIGRKHAMEMLLTGEPVPAARAAEIGLINAAVDGDQLESHVYQVADLITSKSSSAIAQGKPAFVRQIDLSLDEAYELASAVMVENCMTPDCQEGIAAFLEKRSPRWW